MIEPVNIFVPEDLENMQLPNPELLTFYKNFNDRILWIGEDITDFSIQYAKYIMQWNREDVGIPVDERKPIRIMFFSCGGDLAVNNLLIDTITLSKTKVIGINCGLAESAACYIFLSCHERYTLPNAKFLIHQGAGSFEGTYDQVVAAICNYQNEIESLGEFVLSRTNIPEDVFVENFSTDWYLTADEAIAYGVCSKIITDIEEII